MNLFVSILTRILLKSIPVTSEFVMIYIEGPMSKFNISQLGGVHISARSLLDIKLIWFLAISLAYPSGDEEGVFFWFKLFLPAFAGPNGGGGTAPCGKNSPRSFWVARDPELIRRLASRSRGT
jgi:hypothetical protein